ncbi:hypothetical protein [Planctomicrobium piriforme]|uniref:Uncharacterized protein n=1 Tax=Planctomicrobium piriforme TaxID=1576369 RepID=A0A1I3RYR6_9PLAN|nr:hypothetical protein [Planctomicrobium piriforme]SFJ51774.1 hypothetical protein SAMN05421753_12256 [Planctomicrobium piriforme]
MLTTRHLAVIQAALQFFDEEFSPHEPDISAPYFDKPLSTPLTAEEVRQLRTALQSCRLAYAVCDLQGEEFLELQLEPSLERVTTAAAQAGRVATVLLWDAPA